MDALVAPLERVVEAAEWFVRTPSVRVLHVLTTRALRDATLRHLTAAELLEPNTSPFFVLEAPTEPGDDGWSLRADELREDWRSLAESAASGDAVGPLWPAMTGETPLTRFALELSEAVAALGPSKSGLCVVLAPVWVRAAERWRSDLEILLHVRGLSRVRFIIVEQDEAAASAVLDKLGSEADWVDGRPDELEVRREMKERLAALERAPAGATGHQLVGAASSPAAPPPRRGRPVLSAEERSALAAEANVSPVLLDPDAMKRLRLLVLSAASAMAEGNPLEALRLQRQARDFCATEGLVREAVVNELVLGGYVVQAGSPERAIEVFASARGRADEAGLVDASVQAQMAIGACLLVRKRVEEAAAAYGEAGQIGAASAPILAIEAYRLCGQLLLSLGRADQAATAFRRGVAVAQKGADAAMGPSTAGTAARQLAALCREHGLVLQAESLEAQALALEATPPAMTPQTP